MEPSGEAIEALLAAFRQFVGSAGDAVPARFSAALQADFPARALGARVLPCVTHLARAAAIAPAGTQPLAERLARLGPALHWGQTYRADELGQAFLDNYGWVELVGARGHFASDALAAGFLLLGPHTLYPDHHHKAEEVYIPLTGGSDWRMGDAPFRRRAAGEIIHHAANVPHAMRTGAEPLLALYLWRGGPLAQHSVLTGVSS